MNSQTPARVVHALLWAYEARLPLNACITSLVFGKTLSNSCLRIGFWRRVKTDSCAFNFGSSRHSTRGSTWL